MSLVQKAKEHIDAAKEIHEDERLSIKERRAIEKYIKETFQKKKRAPTEWNMLVQSLASENKGLPLTDIVHLAKKLYVKQSVDATD